MLIGYARVSTDDQDLRLQRAALLEAGADRQPRKKRCCFNWKMLEQDCIIMVILIGLA